MCLNPSISSIYLNQATWLINTRENNKTQDRVKDQHGSSSNSKRQITVERTGSLYHRPQFKRRLIAKINPSFRCLKPFGYINDNITVSDLTNDADDHELFHKVCSPYHYLHHLPPASRICNNMRLRGHTYYLPTVYLLYPAL